MLYILSAKYNLTSLETIVKFKSPHFISTVSHIQTFFYVVVKVGKRESAFFNDKHNQAMNRYKQ